MHGARACLPPKRLARAEQVDEISAEHRRRDEAIERGCRSALAHPVHKSRDSFKYRERRRCIPHTNRTPVTDDLQPSSAPVPRLDDLADNGRGCA